MDIIVSGFIIGFIATMYIIINAGSIYVNLKEIFTKRT